jgi:hypothetical protein
MRPDRQYRDGCRAGLATRAPFAIDFPSITISTPDRDVEILVPKPEVSGRPEPTWLN